MDDFNFADLFKIELSIFELLLRASILYLGILVLMRIMPRRTGGELAIMDLVFIFLISEAAAHSLGDYTSIPEGFVIICTLIFWDYTINWLSFKSRFFEKLFAEPPLKIIESGKKIKKNMRKEFITEDELQESLHKEGLEDVSQVKAAYVEGDGTITFIKNSASE